MERRGKIRLVIVTAIVLLVLGILLYRSSVGSLSYFKTVTDLKKDPSLVGKSVRVGGEVVKGSVVQRGTGVSFVITDQKNKLKIVYDGSMPSTFGEGIQVIAEGTYSGGKEFKAVSLITKCPSRYKSQKIRAQ